MKYILLALTALVIPSIAEAQSIPAWKSYQQTGNPADIVPSAGTPNSVAQWLGKKVDVTGGTSENQTVNTPKIIGGTATGTNINRVISLLSYGAKCDGQTDDTAAIKSWLANATGTAHISLSAPSGTCIFTSPLSNPTGASSGIEVKGSGAYSTTFLYEGSDATVDLLTIGDGINGQTNWTLHDFMIRSATPMTGGAAIHAKGLTRSGLSNIIIDGQEGNGNLWNGLWLDGVDYVTTSGHNYAWAKNDAIRVNASPLGAADLSLKGFKISPPNRSTPASNNVGLHIGGGFGGLYCTGGTDIIGNGTNMLVDTTLYNMGNREFYLDGGCPLDSAATGYNLDVEDTLSSLYFSLSGAWIASAKKGGIYLPTNANGWFVINGGTIYNNGEDGIEDYSRLNISVVGTIFRNNGTKATGYGFNEAGTNPGVSLIGAYFTGNSGGDTLGTSANITAYGGTNGGIAMGSRLAMRPDSSGNACVEAASSNGSDNCAFGIGMNSSNQTEVVKLGNNATNPALEIDSNTMWVSDSTKCGSFPSAKGCYYVINPAGTKTFVPAF